jgi:Outer membrane protein beta-barrel domain
MSDKKHIDELFKEPLQNYEAAPSPDVWKSIQAAMKKEKDDRKVIPLWWKLGGVAAALALLLIVGNLIFNPSDDNLNTTIVSEEDNNTNLNEDSNTPVEDNLNKETISSENTTEEQIEGDVEKSSIEKEGPNTLKDKIIKPSQKNLKGVAVEQEIEGNDLQKRNDLIKKDQSVDALTKKRAVATTLEKKNASKNETEVKNTDNTEIEVQDPVINKDVSVGIAKNVSEGVTKITDKADISTKKEISKVNEAISGVDNQKEDADTNDEKPDEKKSIFDAIEEDKKDAIAKEEDNDAQNWEVTPNFGPVFYNSLGQGSSIDPAFSDNSQSGDVNFSYGVQVSYNVNDRLSLRSGLSNVKLGYTTGGIELATGPVAIALRSIDYGGRSVVLTAFDSGTLANLPPSQGEGDPFGDLNPKSTSGNAELIQNLSYYEVPMELKYALVNNRFGVNVIGGLSTLFLDDNEVSVRDGEFRDVLGPANNLNSVSFSTNVGVGFDYKISKRLKFNVEPMFKYQLNPYTDSSVDFKPYYIGIYSGLSFKF